MELDSKCGRRGTWCVCAWNVRVVNFGSDFVGVWNFYYFCSLE